MAITNLIAVDLGASSGRLISGQFDGDQIHLKEQFRFSNQPVAVNGHLYWDYLKIFQEIKYGLAIARRDLGRIDGMSIDTWGVDYGILSQRGELLFAPHSYRDSRTDAVKKAFYQRMSPCKLFLETGNQAAMINTNVQLFADVTRYPFLLTEGADVLMMPNLIGYFFTGVKQTDFTIASTSGLLDVANRDWDEAVLHKLGIPRSWFGQLVTGGAVLGPLRPEIQAELQLNEEMQVINGVGHDTAAAVLALPLTPEDWQQTAFISCGTWSIIGRKTVKPIVSLAAADAGLTNEGCFDGSNRLLQNVTGLWIVQELQREWSYQGEMVDFGKMTAEAQAAQSLHSYIDPNHPLFTGPSRMEEKIEAFLHQTGQPVPQSRGQLVRTVLESLAMTYRQTIFNLEQGAEMPLTKIHMFGGGIQNQLLVQLTADLTQMPVSAGPIEASVTGNIVSQLLVLKKLAPEDVAATMKQSYTVAMIQPQVVPDLDAQFKAFQQMVEKGKAVAAELPPKMEAK